MTNQVNQDERAKRKIMLDAAQLACDGRFSDSTDHALAHEFYVNGWQAATQASDSEINSLKQRVEELTADNNQLREALNSAQEFVDSVHVGEWSGSYSRNEINFIIQEALSSTPKQSLVERDNEVIERCAKVCNELINLRGADASHKFMADKCAANIRALKGK